MRHNQQMEAREEKMDQLPVEFDLAYPIAVEASCIAGLTSDASPAEHRALRHAILLELQTARNMFTAAKETEEALLKLRSALAGRMADVKRLTPILKQMQAASAAPKDDDSLGHTLIGMGYGDD